MNVFRNGLIFTAGLLIAVPAWAQEAKKDAVAAEAAEVPVDAADAPAADAPVDAPVDGQTEKPAAEGAKGETVLGPGGRPLRTDYPGTDESLLSRMDTNQVQGLQIDGNQPQEAYQMRIQELETKIDDLKEKVFQSKTRIVLLRETLLSGNLAGARAILIHKTDLGSAFKLREALYSLDGTKIFGQVDKNDSLADKRTFEFYNGTVSPGVHNLSVFLKYQGSGYGVFTYFDGYEFDIRTSCQFKAEEGKIAQIRVVAFEKGNVATSKENRPDTRCEVQYFDNVKTEEPVAQQDKP